MSPLDELLIAHGYKLVDDSWKSHGRLTYDHNDEADREFISGLEKRLRSLGWERHPTILRAFRHRSTGELIEVEPGGADTTGNFLHVIRKRSRVLRSVSLDPSCG